ncbi:MAG: hypothetical protein J6K28_04740 [Alistipes sp.]|nr:hypothetical protein [Alistipes sp.]
MKRRLINMSFLVAVAAVITFAVLGRDGYVSALDFGRMAVSEPNAESSPAASAVADGGFAAETVGPAADDAASASRQDDGAAEETAAENDATDGNPSVSADEPVSE